MKRDDLRGIIIVAVIFVLCGFLVGVPIALRSSPIVQTENLTGTIVNVATTPLNPKAAAGRGFRYRYGIRLDQTGGLAFAMGEIDTPLPLGSRISVERQIHKNGFETYVLTNNAR